MTSRNGWLRAHKELCLALSRGHRISLENERSWVRILYWGQGVWNIHCSAVFRNDLVIVMTDEK
jgi:hypothetical protein